MLSARAVVAVSATLLLGLGACSSGASSPRSAAPTPAPSATRPPVAPSTDGAAVDMSSRKSAQKTLDRAFDQLIDDASGDFATYVNFDGEAIRVVGSYDLADLELESLTSFSGSDGPTGLKGRVVGGEIYGGPDFGPYAKCWFHYAEGSLDDLYAGDQPVQEDLASYPAAVVLASDARAVGELESDSFQIRAKVSAQTALATLSSRFAATVAAKLPEDDFRTSATVTVRNGRFTNLVLEGDDVASSFERAGVDLFTGDNAAFEAPFRSGTLNASFTAYGSSVDVRVPPADSVVEFAGPDDVDASGTACAASSS